MHEAALARAALPVPTVVLGMLLRPLSLGHILQFHRDGIMGQAISATLTPEQLTAAVLTCCQSWEEAKAIHADRLIGFKLWLWKRRVFRTSRAYAKRGVRYFDGETETFTDYLRLGALDFPETDRKRPDRVEGGRPPGTPFILRLQQWLMTHFRLKESEAWDYPFGLAKMRWACHWEQEGGIDIYNEGDESANRYIAEQEALDAAERAKKGGVACPV